MGNLALQVGHVHLVVVHDGDLPHSRGRQIQRGRRAQAASADDEYMCIEDSLLAFDADFIEQDVTRIAQEFTVFSKAKSRASRARLLLDK